MREYLNQEDHSLSEQEKKRREALLQRPDMENFERQLGQKFHTIHHGIDRYFSKSHENSGCELTRAQCGVLHFLYDHQAYEIYQKDIEAVFAITGATATNILKGMERQNLIRRVPTEEDARKKRITLTAEGIRHQQAACENVAYMERLITDGMTEEEITIYRSLLDRTIQNLEFLRTDADRKTDKK